MPVPNPVVPLFPLPPESRGHNPRKPRNRAGIIAGSPAGTGEVVFSNVTAAKGRRKRDWDGGGDSWYGMGSGFPFFGRGVMVGWIVIALVVG